MTPTQAIIEEKYTSQLTVEDSHPSSELNQINRPKKKLAKYESFALLVIETCTDEEVSYVQRLFIGQAPSQLPSNVINGKIKSILSALQLSKNDFQPSPPLRGFILIMLL